VIKGKICGMSVIRSGDETWNVSLKCTLTKTEMEIIRKWAGSQKSLVISEMHRNRKA